MGKELECVACFEGKTGAGKAHLDGTGLTFRGEFRLVIAQGSVTGVGAEKGVLTVRFEGKEATFEMGSQAEKWAEAIANPPGLLQKLGVKAGQRVGLVGFERHPAFADELVREGAVVEGKLKAGLDWVFVGVEGPEDLEELEGLKGIIAPKGGVWAVYPRGVKVVTEAMVLASAQEAGFVVPKVCRFSETHTAHKLVLPKEAR